MLPGIHPAVTIEKIMFTRNYQNNLQGVDVAGAVVEVEPVGAAHATATKATKHRRTRIFPESLTTISPSVHLLSPPSARS